MKPLHHLCLCCAIAASANCGLASTVEEPAQLTLSWANNFLTIHGAYLPGGQVRIQYLEAYCRPGSTDRDWRETVIKHKTELVSRSPDGKALKLRCTLTDGVIVVHEITAATDEVTFRLTATNPTNKSSEAHWA